jgi:cytoskeletal protein RodZ
MRSVVVTVVLGLVAIALVAFLALHLLNGSSSDTPKQANNNAPTTSSSSGASATGSSGTKKKAKATPTPPPRSSVSVEVYNGTGTANLAAQLAAKLGDAGYAQGKLKAGNDPAGQTRATSTVVYKKGDEPAAKDVAKVLDIHAVKQMDTATQQASTYDVIVEVGADKSGT